MTPLGRSLLVMTASLLLTATGFAQSYPNAEYHADGNGGDQSADLRFMREAVQQNRAKIDLAFLALQNSDNEQVKAFALQVLGDYRKANGDLGDIATQQFVELPAAVDSKDQHNFEALSQLRGAAFNKAYMEAMLQGQQKDIARLKQEAAKGNNQSMIDWARQTLPTIETTYKEAQKVAPLVGVHATLTSEEQKALNAGKPASTASQGAR